ncbi:hypothetical protein AVEN_192425-1 [Araneus ventricosus]|uniref:Uncharacterized protein n=1 Tax=Araneus ventricosus TaxID=182803 RepID=A0A4Y2WL84_ARAVE|nr:hypothetical protein AVEN_192425-1 [Araneus ventricosus]
MRWAVLLAKRPYVSHENNFQKVNGLYFLRMSSLNSNTYSQDGEILPFQMDYLPEFFRKKCETELRETPENKKKRMQELKTMIAGAVVVFCYCDR